MPVISLLSNVRTLAITAAMLLVFGGNLVAQESTKPTTEPVYREARANEAAESEATARNNDVPAKNASRADSTAAGNLAPIDRALNIARDGLSHIRGDIRDYSATLIKRERINGAVTDPEFMEIKIRNRNEAENAPLSIYMNFLKPSAVKGREVIWVEGQNDGKLIAHEGSGVITMTVRLDPDGFIAMRGNRYPIYECGIENLVYRLIEKGERDKALGDATVKFYEETKINGRACTLIQVTHPHKRPEYDFHICRIFIDKELGVPIRYAAYGWPETEGGKPTLEEEYTYLNMKLNVGLTDADFNPDNPEYNFK